MFAQITELLPEIEAAAQQIESERHLPAALVARLKTAGAFRLLIPAAFGGLEAGFTCM
jgi:indole-3-acetate monooxygenase